MALGYIADETTPEDGAAGSSILSIIEVINWISAHTVAGGVTPPPL
ncbi:hypothetical protein RHCRD62_60278 [Rhodococcus sp. RD6.2]|nr:hypothetical protein [Rhodococcus sp. RD6.2]CRK53511.1 hypothetical protein RHCRD62_60278 [Rhodococcus sp. RD6.2]